MLQDQIENKSCRADGFKSSIYYRQGYRDGDSKLRNTPPDAVLLHDSIMFNEVTKELLSL